MGKIKVTDEIVVIGYVYASVMGKSENERDTFWENLNKCFGVFFNGERVTMLGDMNAKVEDNGIDRVIGRFGESGVNEMEEKVVDLCSERFV